MIILTVFFSFVVLIILHELGHFLLAKKFGIKVEEFGIGFPPRLWGKKIGETLYSLNLLPFGGFVKIFGHEKRIDHPRSFTTKPFYQKALVIIGGVAVFWVVAAILLSIVMVIGVPSLISDDEPGILNNPKVQIAAVSSDSPAQKAELKVGDEIRNIKCPAVDIEINKVKEVQDSIEKCKGKETILAIQRGKDILDVSLTPRISPPEGEGSMGVALLRTALKSYPFYIAPIKGIEATGTLTIAIVRGWGALFKSLFQGDGVPGEIEVKGIVGIFELFVQAGALGTTYFLQLIAMITISLALLNILPIPALDGGWLLFLVIEKIKGKPLNQKIVQNISMVFFFLLIALMVWVNIKDIIRIF